MFNMAFSKSVLTLVQDLPHAPAAPGSTGQHTETLRRACDEPDNNGTRFTSLFRPQCWSSVSGLRICLLRSGFLKVLLSIISGDACNCHLCFLVMRTLSRRLAVNLLLLWWTGSQIGPGKKHVDLVYRFRFRT